MDQSKFYTIEVVLNDTTRHEFKNIPQDHAEMFKSVVWKQGVTIKVSDKIKEQVSPFRIYQVFITEQ